MHRDDIKYKLRESLTALFEDSDKEEEEKGKTKDNQKPLDKRDQTSIKNALDKDKNPLAPAISQVMKQVTGDNPNNATARSEFIKKIKQKNGLGLNDEEKSRTEVALGIK